MSLTYKSPQSPIFDKPPGIPHKTPMVRRFLSLAAKSIFSERNVSIRPSNSPSSFKCFEREPSRLFAYKKGESRLCLLKCESLSIGLIEIKALYKNNLNCRIKSAFNNRVKGFGLYNAPIAPITDKFLHTELKNEPYFYAFFSTTAFNAEFLSFGNKINYAPLSASLTQRARLKGVLERRSAISRGKNGVIECSKKPSEKSGFFESKSVIRLAKCRHDFGVIGFKPVFSLMRNFKPEVNRVKIFLSQDSFKVQKPSCSGFSALKYLMSLSEAAFDCDRLEISNLVIVYKSVFNPCFALKSLKCPFANALVCKKQARPALFFAFTRSARQKEGFKALWPVFNKINAERPVFEASFEAARLFCSTQGRFNAELLLSFKRLKYRLRLSREKLGDYSWQFKTLLTFSPLKIKSKKSSGLLISYLPLKTSCPAFCPQITPAECKKPGFKLGRYRLQFTLKYHSRRVLKKLKAIILPKSVKSLKNTLTRYEKGFLSLMRVKGFIFGLTPALRRGERVIEQIYLRRMPFFMSITQLEFTDIFLLESQRRIKTFSAAVFYSHLSRAFKTGFAQEPLKKHSSAAFNSRGAVMLRPARKIIFKSLTLSILKDLKISPQRAEAPMSYSLWQGQSKPFACKCLCKEENFLSSVPRQIKKALPLGFNIIKSAVNSLNNKLWADTPQYFKPAVRGFNCRIRLYPYPFGFISFKASPAVFVFSYGSYGFKPVSGEQGPVMLPKPCRFGSAKNYFSALSLKKPRRFLFSFKNLIKAKSAYSVGKAALPPLNALKLKGQKSFLFDAFNFILPKLNGAFSLTMRPCQGKAGVGAKAFMQTLALYKTRFCLKTERISAIKSAGIKRLLFVNEGDKPKQTAQSCLLSLVLQVKPFKAKAAYALTFNGGLCDKAPVFMQMCGKPISFSQYTGEKAIKETGKPSYFARYKWPKALYRPNGRLVLNKTQGFINYAYKEISRLDSFDLTALKPCFYAHNIVKNSSFGYLGAEAYAQGANAKPNLTLLYKQCAAHSLIYAPITEYSVLCSPIIRFKHDFNKINQAQPLLYLLNNKRAVKAVKISYSPAAKRLCPKMGFEFKSAALGQYLESRSEHWLILPKGFGRLNIRAAYSFNGVKRLKGFEAERVLSLDKSFSAEQALNADKGFSAEQALSSDKGFNAEQALNSDKGFNAEQALNSDKGFSAERALHSDKGFSAEQALNSDKGFNAEQALNSDKGFNTEQALKAVKAPLSFLSPQTKAERGKAMRQEKNIMPINQALFEQNKPINNLAYRAFSPCLALKSEFAAKYKRIILLKNEAPIQPQAVSFGFDVLFKSSKMRCGRIITPKIRMVLGYLFGSLGSDYSEFAVAASAGNRKTEFKPCFPPELIELAACKKKKFLINKTIF